MSDDVRYQIHLRILNQIKNRPNQYPIYIPDIKRRKSPNPNRKEIEQLMSQIKTNTNNISTIKKSFEKKKPVNYDDEDKYIYEKEVEKIQKQMMNQLINKNNNLKTKLKDLQNYNKYVTYKKK